MKENVVISHNRGLGDYILLNGAVNYLSKCFKNVYYICLCDSRNKFKNIEYMYRNSNNIHLKYICTRSKEKHMRGIVRKARKDYVGKSCDFRYVIFEHRRWEEIGIQRGLGSGGSWAELFYKSFSVPYTARQEYFNLDRSLDRERKIRSRFPSEYSLLIDHSRNFHFNCDIKTAKYPLLRMGEKNRVTNRFGKESESSDDYIFDWISVIEDAKEIFCVDTSWFHLIRNLALNKPKFFIDARRVNYVNHKTSLYLNDTIDKGWIIVDKNGYEK